MGAEKYWWRNLITYTDLYYQTLEGNDYFPDVLLGRFAINNQTEFDNIVNKTIFMEENLKTIEKEITFSSFDDGRRIPYHGTRHPVDSLAEGIFDSINSLLGK